jgi:hypothetical protein
MTSEAVSSWTKIKKVGRQLSPEQVAAAAMVAQAREQGLALTGPNGLLKLFTKSVLENRAERGDDRASRIREARR